MHILYIKQALRTLSRQKIFTGINILGLAISLACCILLSRYLHHETTAESHAIDIDHIMAIKSKSSRDYTSFITKFELVDYLEPSFATYLNEQVVESSWHGIYAAMNFEYNDAKGQEVTRKASAMVADSLLLHFYDYQIEGDREAMKRPDGCWISRNMLNTIGWTPEMAIGQNIRYDDCDYKVAGIFDLPATRCIYTPDLIISKYAKEWWNMGGGAEWFRVRDGFDYNNFNEKIGQFEESDHATRQINYGEEHMTFSMVPWTDIYFDEDLSTKTTGDISATIHFGDATIFWLLTALWIIIFMIGISNFVNLYRVLCMRRRHEQGVRRVFGQKKSQLFLAFWTEASLLIVSAVFIAWLFVELSAPIVSNIMGLSHPYSSFDLWLTIAMIVLLPLLALLIPFFQSIKTPAYVQMLKRSGSVQNLRSRTVFLAVQYFFTFSLLIAAIWMQQHLEFLLDSPTGYQVDNILLATPLHLKEKIYRDDEGRMQYESNSEEVQEKSKLFLNRLLASPHIEKAITGEYTPLSGNITSDVFFGNNDTQAKLYVFSVAPEWLDIFDIPLEEGSLTSDSIESYVVNSWVLNKKALQLMGYDNTEGAFVRKQSPMVWTIDGSWGEQSLPVVGVVSDHYAFHRTVGKSPIAYWVNSISYPCSFIIRTKPGHDQEAVALLEQIHAEVSPNDDLKYHWFRQEIEDQYREDCLIAQVYSLLSVIAVIVCCLGLLGLSLFDIRQRYREIAIRKAHGAHRKDLYLLLGRKYIYMLTATFALSIPVSYLLIHRYTESFIESAPLTPIIYIEALGIVVLITLLTLIYQLEKAARINVATVVKNE